MDREDEIEALLRDAAEVCHDISTRAQKAAAEIVAAEPVTRHLTRTAAVNQVGGMAQWRIVSDGLVRRHQELPRQLKLSTTDKEQNRGFYYFRSTKPALVLTVRRQPHPEEDRPDALQLQMSEVLEIVGADFGGEVVTAYLTVPAFRGEPQFEVVARGDSLVYRLCDLFDATAARGDTTTSVASVADLTPRPDPGATVKSTEDAEEAVEEEGADGSRS